MKHLYIAILLTLAMGISACGAEPSPTEIFESPLSPLPTPTMSVSAAVEVNTPTAIPTPRPGMGAVTGQFVDYASGKPVVERLFYLGEVSSLAAGEEGQDSQFVVMIPGTSLKTTSDKDGRFALLDVEPGTYVFVVWTPSDSWVVTDPEGEENIVVIIEAGEVTDLGTIPIETPP
jgi:hypothetical protein